jgi:SAM-dependent methyltransferase
VLLYALTVFLSAFLLFAVQPIVAKTILPWFGGSSAVWSACMLFFQAVLVLGYGYAHWLHHTLAVRKQTLLHIAALAISVATLPIIPGSHWRTVAAGLPALRILALLSLTVGLPYFLLSSTSPLLQAWYARNHKEGIPYRLFALSNLASLLALIGYPLLVEPNLSIHWQAWIWSGAYAGFALCCGFTAWRAAAHPAAEFAAAPEIAADGAAPANAPPSVRLLWLLLAASASVLLLAVTNHLTQDIAAIPFLWILPLSVYLLSFIVCFESPRLYYRPVFAPMLLAALGFLAYRIWPARQALIWPFVDLDMRPAIVYTTVALFICCMVCHGELSRLKPHPRFLTGFYVTVSLGGAMGGLFVGLLAPSIFRAYYEFPIGLGLCAAVAPWVLARELARFRFWPRLAGAAVLAILLGGYLWFLSLIMRQMVDGYLVAARNFYGQLRVMDSGDPARDPYASRILIHGTINHGAQFHSERYRRQPVTYFCPESGIGRAIDALERAPRRIGMLGMGCGTIAAYGRPGDRLRIYEINPLVPMLARTWFTYLRDTPAAVEVSLGDGRLSLESEPSQQFDLLIMDAFSGDSVPVHLITREALATYFRHLKPGGILAINTTNRYLDLNPVVERGAASFGKLALAYAYEPDPGDVICFACDWALILDRATLDRHPELAIDADLLRPHPRLRTWTDDFSNMLQILK